MIKINFVVDFSTVISNKTNDRVILLNCYGGN